MKLYRMCCLKARSVKVRNFLQLGSYNMMNTQVCHRTLFAAYIAEQIYPSMLHLCRSLEDTFLRTGVSVESYRQEGSVHGGSGRRLYQYLQASDGGRFNGEMNLHLNDTSVR